MKQLILCSAMACLCVNLSAMKPDENQNHDNPIRSTHVVSDKDTHKSTLIYLILSFLMQMKRYELCFGYKN